MKPRVPHQQPSTAKRPSLAGQGVLERMRSTTFALLGGTALFCLLIVGIMSQQGFGLLPPLPVPGLSQGDEGVSGAAALGSSGDSVVPGVSGPVIVGSADTAGTDTGVAAPGEAGKTNLGGSRQLDSAGGNREPDTGQPGSQPAPQPTPTPVEPAPTTVSQPTAPSSSGDEESPSPSPSTPPKTDAGTAALGGSTTSGSKPPPASKVPDSVQAESTPATPAAPSSPSPSVPSGSPGPTDAEKAEGRR